MLSLRTSNPFPLQSFCQHDSGQISTREHLLSLLNLKPGDNLTVQHLPRKMNIKNRSGTDSTSWLNPSRSANFLPVEVYKFYFIFFTHSSLFINPRSRVSWSLLVTKTTWSSHSKYSTKILRAKWSADAMLWATKPTSATLWNHGWLKVRISLAHCNTLQNLNNQVFDHFPRVSCACEWLSSNNSGNNWAIASRWCCTGHLKKIIAEREFTPWGRL